MSGKKWRAIFVFLYIALCGILFGFARQLSPFLLASLFAGVGISCLIAANMIGCLQEKKNAVAKTLHVHSLGVWECALNAASLSCSRQWLREVLGIATPTLSFAEWEARLDPADRILWQQTVRRMRDGNSFVIRYRVEKGRGHIVWVEMAGSQIEPSLFSGTMRDVTGEIQRELVLKEKESLLEDFCDALIDIDPTYVIRSWGRGAVQIFGHTAEAICGQPISTLFTPYAWECLSQELDRLQREKEYSPKTLNCEVNTEGSPTITIKASKVHISREGEPRISLMIRNISGLTDMKKAAYGLLELRGKLITTISRAIRDPLTIVEQTLYLIEEQCAKHVDFPTRELLSITKENLTRLNKVIHEVLDFQQLEMGNFDLSLSEVNINELIKQVTYLLKPDFTAKSLSLHLELDEAMPPLLCDGPKVQQVFLHILDNAVKYTKEGAITITSSHTDDSITIAIRDTGIGIPEKDKSKVFESFAQLHHKTLLQGSGLGLPFSKKIVGMHKGTIDFTSKEGEGSTFFITLPRGNHE